MVIVPILLVVLVILFPGFFRLAFMLVAFAALLAFNPVRLPWTSPPECFGLGFVPCPQAVK